jgi:hypothetical protein
MYFIVFVYSYCYTFCSVYSVSLCCSVYCLCVNVYCTTATWCQPNSSQQTHIISYNIFKNRRIFFVYLCQESAVNACYLHVLYLLKDSENITKQLKLLFYCIVWECRSFTAAMYLTFQKNLESLLECNGM